MASPIPLVPAGPVIDSLIYLRRQSSWRRFQNNQKMSEINCLRKLFFRQNYYLH